MSDQYKHSNKSTGRKPSLNEHKGPRASDKEHFSNMNLVDTSEHHQNSIKNMAAHPKHVASIPINQNHNYKKQSHAVKPPTIQSFVGSRVDGDMGAEPTVKRPGDGGTGYYKKDKKG